MKEAIITPVSGNINWAQVPIIPIDALVKTKVTDVKASAQICYDAEALYLHLSAVESEIRAVEEGPIGSPCSDSCLEFFFCPMEGDMRYFNLEFNPNKCLYLGMGTSLENLTRLIPEEEPNNGTEFTFRPVINRTDDGWEIFYRIPYAFIRRFFPTFEAAPGKTMRANFYKCADMTSKPHYIAWNPITRLGRGVFHTPADFGLLHFA